MKTKVNLTGKIGIQQTLGSIEIDIKMDGAKEAALAAAEVFRDGIEERMPKKSGESARSVTAQIVDAEPGYVRAAAGPDKDHWYIRFKEYGFTDPAGKRHRPEEYGGPFMRPTVDEDSEKAIEAAAAVLRRHVEGV